MKTEEKHLFNDERYEKQFCFGLVVLPSSEEVGGRGRNCGGHPMNETTIRQYADAGYPAVALESYEEQRVIADLKEEFKDIPSRVFSIAAAGGLRDETGDKTVDRQANFPKAFEHISQQKEALLVVFDFQHNINSCAAYRPLLQSLPACKARGSMIVLIAPNWTLPSELKHEIPVRKMPFPAPEELKASLKVVLEVVKKKSLDNEEEILSAARGLTLSQAENVFALSATQNFSEEIVEREKMRLIKSNCMSVEKPRDPESLAGLGQLKNYITQEVLPAKNDDQLRVKGILLVGVPGSGKSLSARVIAALLREPLVRFDVSAAKGSLVGQSESNIRNALATADAVAPCVLWLDEVEKAIAGHASSAITDGGTTLSMLGTLLTWQQEHETPVTVVATCNDYTKLPPELTRYGRFDEKFFLDLPSEVERRAIAEVHLKRLKCGLEFVNNIANLSEEWTGAEIEQLIKSAARRTQRKLNLDAINQCADEVIPISKTTSIQNLREWAKVNLRKANNAADSPTAKRKVKFDA